MTRIEIKPISVNECWQGRRFKTKKYTAWEKEMLLRMPKQKMPPKPYAVNLVFGFSNSASDLDNPLKPTLDLIQKKYGINDKDIVSIYLFKDVVKKGKEYIQFKIVHAE